MNRSLAVIALTLVAVAGVALAADDPIGQRRKIMQDNLRTETKLNNLVLGKYFPDKAAALMQKLRANMTAFVELFPEGSEAGGGTHARPEIWADRVGFVALAQAFIDSTKAAETTAAGGQDAFAAAWQTVAPLCEQCHTAYTTGFGM